jgi:hypothetical protein
MASVRQQIWQVAADDAAFLAGVPDGVNGVLGGESSPPPPAAQCPYYYLELLADVPSFGGHPAVREGGFRWRGYDVPHAGYTRLRAGLLRLLQLYPEETDAGQARDIYRDPATGEVVYWQRAVGLGPETVDQEKNLLQQWCEVQVRKTISGGWP